jgi:hypothetical protein
MKSSTEKIAIHGVKVKFETNGSHKIVMENEDKKDHEMVAGDKIKID